eukprot:NODE_2382_length_1076_cov_1.680717_g2364_i0.p2 GENE.NODE_2382_length_1076_cov_1.680717_g2364_i0~~NODE_2382_length_1076_cov_1.680717_g2364_i0.p2  ORF type:complete len:117 (+),score=7.73 NODE_2382_length_1076_cov_1.680717_g2364_i0:675-1025(+)
MVSRAYQFFQGFDCDNLTLVIHHWNVSTNVVTHEVNQKAAIIPNASNVRVDIHDPSHGVFQSNATQYCSANIAVCNTAKKVSFSIHDKSNFRFRFLYNAHGIANGLALRNEVTFDI